MHVLFSPLSLFDVLFDPQTNWHIALVSFFSAWHVQYILLQIQFKLLSLSAFTVPGTSL